MKRRALFTLALAGLFLLAGRSAAARPNTDVSVTSDGDPFSSVQKKEQEKFGLRFDDTTSLGFNEDGDPALSRQF